jgi:hypothetical protein
MTSRRSLAAICFRLGDRAGCRSRRPGQWRTTTWRGTHRRLAATTPSPANTIVGLGDSYMSGEGVMTSNKNFKNATADGNWTHWSLVPGPYGGDTLMSNGTLDPSTPQVKVWGSVFGDKNG